MLPTTITVIMMRYGLTNLQLNSPDINAVECCWKILCQQFILVFVRYSAERTINFIKKNKNTFENSFL